MVPRAPRNSLTKERILKGALELADLHGLDALTIRGLAVHLGVRPMSIYHYIATKDRLLDALVDVVFEELHTPNETGDWKNELALRAHSMRAALSRHAWALAVMETRTDPGPTTLANHEAVLVVLRTAGFSVAHAGHAYAILDAFVYGFALQDLMLRTAGLDTSAQELHEGINLNEYPRINELAMYHVEAANYPLDASFDIGLSITLDGIEKFLLDGAGTG
ncbi:TetR/AcrR family transcriptional regulator [Timonella sp. A28]|uniref:TetR/AcrR family transcriptional regulator n=1 Tax=Timonella sp. A28 TaxID=3442640 RepID=UPI003EBDE1C9